MNPKITAAWRIERAPLLALVVIGLLYSWIACTADSELGARVPQTAYYNLMVRGWLQGQTDLAVVAPAGLRNLSNPYDRKLNERYRGSSYVAPRLHDLSYFRGKIYAYFSPVPAVIAFLPFHLLTGHWISHQQACLFFCLVGLVAASATVWSLHAHFFKETGPDTLALGLFAMGILLLSPIVLQRPDVWEVPITCAHASWMLCIWSIWRGLARPATHWKWPMLAGICAALAIGSRPSTILGGMILLVPVIRCLSRQDGVSWSGRWTAFLAAIFPLAVMGAALLLFNWVRFGDGLEFGQKYQLNNEPIRPISSAHYFQFPFVWYNLQQYTIDFRGWNAAYPFLKDLLNPPPGPPGHAGSDAVFGLFTNMPAFLSILGLGYAWRALAPSPRRLLFVMVGVFAAVGLAAMAPLLFFISACVRYEFEFASFAAPLAVLGYFSIMAFSTGWSRTLLRGVWYAALFLSIAFCALHTLTLRALAYELESTMDVIHHDNPAALEHARAALALNPRLFVAANNLGLVHLALGDYDAAVQDFARDVKYHPESAVLYCNYGISLMRAGRIDEAIQVFLRSLELDPHDPVTTKLLEDARARQIRERSHKASP